MILFRKANNITGWIIFLIAAITYVLTLEPSVSLWDCGEFTAAAFKLEVGHPPGAPLYLMMARIFSLFAIDKAHVAVCINSLSALASAFTILFLFWTITYLAKRALIRNDGDYTLPNIVAILASGAVGALAFCFSDSFWFSAVEAEVYALSSLFTALVFWCILKWVEGTGNYPNRWLILIAYLMGLSIGVHLLNLLAIPALAMIYYFKKYPFSWKGLISSLLISFLILFTVLYIIIPGTIKLAALFELFGVGVLNLPLNYGLVGFVIAISLSFVLLLRITYLRRSVFWNTLLLCLAAILIGYSSYAMIVIRAQANPPINTGKPGNVFSLLSYLNRDQYGNRPLIYGQYYNAPATVSSTGKDSYVFEDGKYVKVPQKKIYTYDHRFQTFFPRMFSSNPAHVEVYKNWGTITGVPVKVNKNNSSSGTLMKPTFGDNLEFFFKYQVGYMYFRYFMWNFSGKQNDIQGNGGIMDGNWISGVNFIDRIFIGPQDQIPDYLKSNKGHNRYFMLPLLLGILGMIFQFSGNKHYFAIVSFLFFLTGIAIVIYTNQTPLQPRERDYAYTGSFYAFSIWIGLGVLWLFATLKKLLSTLNAAIVAAVVSLCVPFLMFSQNLDDHNRSGRYTIRDVSYNYLNSCAPNAILFTAGDNDTFPLWYLQEVEGIRTDVRVVNLMLLNADWYIDQLKEKLYLSEPLPVSLKHEQYVSGVRSGVYVFEKSLKPVSVNDAFKLISSDDLSSKQETSSGVYVEYIPSRQLSLPVNKIAALKNGALNEKSLGDAADSIQFTLPAKYIGKSEMIVMDMLAHFNWKRPVYFTTPGYKGTLGLDHYMQLDGFAYRLVPVYTNGNDYASYGRIDTDALYDRLMNKFQWRGLQDGKGLVDGHILKTLSIMRVRNNYSRLAMTLVAKDQNSKAEKILDRVMEILPPSRIPYDIYCISLANAYYKCGSQAKGDSITTGYSRQLQQELNYYRQLPSWMKGWVISEKSAALYNLEKLKKLIEENGQDANTK